MTKAEAGRIAAAALAAVALTACKHTHPTTGPGQVSLPILTPSGCREQSLTLYFDSGSDALTDAGRQLVADTSKQLKSCTVEELRLVGLSDPAGTPKANLELSQRRADHVLDAFVRNGTPIPHYTLVARGDAGAVAPSGAVEPVHRRVDVTVVVGK